MKPFPNSSVLLILFFLFCCCELAAQQPRVYTIEAIQAEKAAISAAETGSSQTTNRRIPGTQKALRILPGEVVIFPDQFYAFDSLTMGISSQILLEASRTTITVDWIFVSGEALINGQGDNGAKGNRGKEGNSDDLVFKTRASDGQHGGFGNRGGWGKSLNLYLGQGTINGEVIINLRGGNGGDGGDGGNGGETMTVCYETTKGTNGGDTGEPGRGGSPGDLKAIFGSDSLMAKLNVQRLDGRVGGTGEPGKAGKFIRVDTCPQYITLYDDGKDGEVFLFKVGSVNGGKMPDDHINVGVFPDLPPAASAIQNFLNFKSLPSATFGDVHGMLSAAFEKTGYYGYNVQRWRDGFAIISPIEQIDEHGEELPGGDRWRKRVIYSHSPSILSYLKSLVFPGEGYFRVVVFLVGTPGDQITSARPTTKEEAMSWFEASTGGLPSDLVDKPFGSTHRISALVYDFVKLENAEGASISKPLNQRSDSFLRTSKLFTSLD